MGFATELDKETGNLNFKVPFEMAPYYERTISFGTKPQSAPAKNGQKGMPVLKGKVSESTMITQDRFGRIIRYLRLSQTQSFGFDGLCSFMRQHGLTFFQDSREYIPWTYPACHIPL